MAEFKPTVPQCLAVRLPRVEESGDNLASLARLGG